jgi:hypothetical protein
MSDKIWDNKAKTIFCREKLRKIIRNHEISDRTTEQHGETGYAEENRKQSNSCNTRSTGGKGSQNHNHKVSQANMMTTDWQT